MENQPLAATSTDDDLLWRHLKSVPAFRALLRAVEARFYRNIELPSPILDLGCGDGHFAQMTFNSPLCAGVDPWWGPLQKARRTGAYQIAIQALGNSLPFPDSYFRSVISNSVLEHISDVQDVLNESARVLQPDGKLVITMPSHYFSEWLGGAAILNRFGLSGLADQYRHLFNRVARHVHTDPPVSWATRLAVAGFSIDHWQYYFSKRALWALELGHVQGLPSAILHFLTGHWILAPWRENLRRTEQWLRSYYEEQPGPEGAYILIVASKHEQSAELPLLPEARPMDISAARIQPASSLDAGRESQTPAPVGTANVVAESDRVAMPDFVPEGVGPVSTSEVAEPVSSPRVRSGLIPAILVGLSLLFAAIGQALIGASTASPASGLRWYGLSLATLSMLALRGRSVPLPVLAQPGRLRLSQMPRRRWLYVLALALGLWAQRAANGPAPRPAAAIIVWILSALAAFYALDADLPRHRIVIGRQFAFDAVVALLLFLGAFVLRAVKLTQHPFILNGAEASLGLDALAVLNGTLRSPFASGWLTNPTFPAFLLAVPIGLLGPSVMSIRFLSPIVGATTVVAVYLAGCKFWDRRVGIIAALLLAGSRFHLQYSRLGLTNIWDPLFMLLALGLIGRAWSRRSGDSQRRDWLWAAMAVGLNVYFFTSARLLPLILLLLFVLTLFSERPQLKRRWRNLLAAAAMAFIVAMPQILFYAGRPTLFMDRANSLGIFSGQSGWLDQQASQTGLSSRDLLQTQFLRSILAFNSSDDRSPSFRPETSLLGFGPSILFIFGLAISAFRWRRGSYRALIAWVVIDLVFAAALLIETPSSHRLVNATPAVYLLAAIGLVYVADLITSNLRARGGRHSLARYMLPAVLSLSLLLTVGDVLFYFGRYQSQHTFGDRNTEIADVMSDYLNSLGGEWTVYFHGPPSMYVRFPTITFLATEHVPDVNLYDVISPDADTPLSATPNNVHIFLPERIDELEPVSEQFPGGQVYSFAGYFADPLFYAYEMQE